ncbi:unnamed protein product [Acanthocheilonema viteae]|uniref:Major facilitator superfamily (MFS) profile domain-containing protein n=1 Tax=Acanthocheilonema viteae TaxID=6277 RepID=A0A498SD07_ACAVI|nr:unnamed protein product [Acanthocheilonema viteae]
MIKYDKEDKGKAQSSEVSKGTEFKISDIQICGNYVVYLTVVYFFMVLSQFDIPVEYVKLGTTVQNIGLMIGAIVAGNLADIFGRKKVLLSFTVGLIIFLIATPFSPSFIVFTIFRFFDMIFTGGKHCVCNPYFMENLPDKHRMWLATVVTYSPNYIILAGIAYLCKNWKILSWVAAGIAVLPLFTIPFLMDTPRWLIKKGKGKEASKAAVYIRKWDEKLTPEKTEKIIAVTEKETKEELAKMKKGKKNYYFYHLFSDWNLGSYAVVFAASLFSTSFISYGIAYNMDALAGTVYINVIILGGARWSINILAAMLEFSIKSVGRRLLHLVAVGFIAVTMGVIFVIYIFTWPKINIYKAVVKAGGTGEESIHAVIMFTRYASLLAAAMCTEIFVLDSVQPAELFPTPIRSAGIAFIQTFNRLGTIVSPLVFIPSKHWPPAPFLLMFITSAVDFLLYFFLVPETRGKKLPDNMPGEEFDLHEDNTQSTESTTNAESHHFASQNGKKAKKETETKTGEDDETESGKSEDKKEKRESVGNEEKTEEKKEEERGQKSSE